MKQWSEIIRNVSLVGQLGLSILTPTIGCLLFCMFLQNKFGLGGWIFIPGFILGLGSSATVVWKFYLSLMKNEQKEKEKEEGKKVRSREKMISFNRHI